MNSEPIYKEFLLGEGLSELKKIGSSVVSVGEIPA